MGTPTPIAIAIHHDSDGETTKRRVDRAIAALAHRRHGVVSRAQLVAAGLGRGAIDLRVSNGRLHPLHPSVYDVGHLALAAKARWMAAVLAGGAGAALSHRAAAALWEIRRSDGPLIEVTSPRQRRSRTGLRYCHSALSADEVTIEDGIPVTTVARTCSTSRPSCRPASSSARSTRPRSAGSGIASPCPICSKGIHAGRAGTRNELEDGFRALLRRARLPRPVTNAAFHVGTHWIEPDCMWPQQRLIAELDGYDTHRTRKAYEDDRARDRALVAAGWRVIRITWRQLGEEPEVLARDLRAALRGAGTGSG